MTELLRQSGAVLGPLGATQVVTSAIAFGEALSFSLFVQRSSPFWIGDLLIQAEAAYGDDFYQHLDDCWSLDMMQRYVGVARKVPRENRVEGLSWSHHQCVAIVPTVEQRPLLEHAKQEGMTSGQFRKYVSAWRRAAKCV